jgi:hypothetical protein
MGSAQQLFKLILLANCQNANAKPTLSAFFQILARMLRHNIPSGQLDRIYPYNPPRQDFLTKVIRYLFGSSHYLVFCTILYDDLAPIFDISN